MNNLTKYFFIASLICSNKVFGQECRNLYSPYKIGYIYSRPGSTNKLDSTQSEINLVLESGFNDSLEILFNEKIIFKGFVKTNRSTGYTGETLNIDYSAIKGNGCIVISSISDKSGINLGIQRGFVLLRVSKGGNNQWSVTYSNSPVVYE
jgi:hypothetical protein